MAVRMSGGDAITESLLLWGVDTIFGIPGIQTYDLYDAFSRVGDRLNVIGPRHEQTAAYMAYGYAKSTGKVGVYTVVPGPGVLNTAAALSTAYATSAPVICVTGQVPSHFIGLGKGHLHELPNQLSTMRTLSKWATRIEHPAEAPPLIAEAFRQSTSGRPGPVVLEMPWDIFGMKAPVQVVLPCSYPAILPDPDEIEKAAKILKTAKNPMIMVGSGAVNAAPEVLRLAEQLQAPVVSLRGGRGVVSDEHYLGFTCAEGYKRWHETDVLIGIGSRLELQWFRWPDQPAGMKIINIDIAPSQAARIKPTLSIVGDAKESVRDLAAILSTIAEPHASREEEFTEIKRKTHIEIQKIQPHMDYLKAIRDVLPRDGFFVEEVCQMGFSSYYGFPIYEPRKFVTTGCQGTLGFGYPTALGVKAGNPDKAVVSIAGDGGFQFGLQELATAVQYGLNVVVMVFNNNAFGNVRRDQAQLFQGRTLGSELRNPDFVKLAESYGMRGYKAENPDSLRTSLEHALSASAPALIEIPTNNFTESSPWEFIMPHSQTKEE
jgi:acetolactate synthase I/II/III large subunit